MLAAVLLLAGCGHASAKDPFVGTWQWDPHSLVPTTLVIAKVPDGYRATVAGLWLGAPPPCPPRQPACRAAPATGFGVDTRARLPARNGTSELQVDGNIQGGRPEQGIRQHRDSKPLSATPPLTDFRSRPGLQPQQAARDDRSQLSWAGPRLTLSCLIAFSRSRQHPLLRRQPRHSPALRGR